MIIKLSKLYVSTAKKIKWGGVYEIDSI